MKRASCFFARIADRRKSFIGISAFRDFPSLPRRLATPLPP